MMRKVALAFDKIAGTNVTPNFSKTLRDQNILVKAFSVLGGEKAFRKEYEERCKLGLICREDKVFSIAVFIPTQGLLKQAYAQKSLSIHDSIKIDEALLSLIKKEIDLIQARN